MRSLHPHPLGQHANPRFPTIPRSVLLGLLVECFFLIPLSITPEKSEELALAVDEALRSESDYEVKKIAAKLFDSLTRHSNTKVRLSLASGKRLAKLAT